MRIGFDAKRAFKNFTGLGNYSRSTIAALSDFYPDNEYFLYTPPYANHQALSFANRANITIRQPKGCWKFLSSVWRSTGISGAIRRDKIQLFHGLNAELPAGISSQIRTVVTVHDLIFLRYPEYYKAVDRWIYTKKYKSACRRADLIIAISEQTKRDIVDFFGIDEKKIRLVYQGCDPQFYNSATANEKQAIKRNYQLPDKYILYVGTIEPRKNLLTLVKALALLPNDISLVAVGRETGYAEKVKQEIVLRQLEGRVLFLNNVKYNHLPAIYQQAQVFCLPSLFEGFGIPVLEGLNSGVPVVTSNSSSLPEAGGPAGLYVDPMDEKAIAAAINNVLVDSALRETMISKGEQHAKLFREENIAQNIWKIYNELL